MDDKQVSSPCILVCSIDMKTGYCFGCGRTGTEITDWQNYTESQRLSIMDNLPARLETVERPARRITRRARMRQKAEGGSTQ